MLNKEFKELLEDLQNASSLSNESQRKVESFVERMNDDEDWEPNPDLLDEITDIWLEEYNA